MTSINPLVSVRVTGNVSEAPKKTGILASIKSFFYWIFSTPAPLSPSRVTPAPKLRIPLPPHFTHEHCAVPVFLEHIASISENKEIRKLVRQISETMKGKYSDEKVNKRNALYVKLVALLNDQYFSRMSAHVLFTNRKAILNDVEDLFFEVMDDLTVDMGTGLDKEGNLPSRFDVAMRAFKRVFYNELEDVHYHNMFPEILAAKIEQQLHSGDAIDLEDVIPVLFYTNAREMLDTDFSSEINQAEILVAEIAARAIEKPMRENLPLRALDELNKSLTRFGSLKPHRIARIRDHVLDFDSVVTATVNKFGKLGTRPSKEVLEHYAKVLVKPEDQNYFIDAVDIGLDLYAEELERERKAIRKIEAQARRDRMDLAAEVASAKEKAKIKASKEAEYDRQVREAATADAEARYTAKRAEADKQLNAIEKMFNDLENVHGFNRTPRPDLKAAEKTTTPIVLALLEALKTYEVFKRNAYLSSDPREAGFKARLVGIRKAFMESRGK